jgi:endonuclease YncB( thermonuclease family)
MRGDGLRRGVLLAGALLALAGLADARERLEGRVVGVTDGDTLTVLPADRHPVRVRLAGIDAPERGQPFGARAKRSLAELTFGREVRVEVLDHDRYGRVVGRVVAETVDVNREQVRRGLAWVFRRDSHDEGDVAAETEARAARRGLWADDNPEPPWAYRATRRRSGAEPVPEPP